MYETQIEKLELGKLVALRQDLKFIDSSLPRYLIENCDLALGIFGDTEKAKAAVPNKLIEALTLGIPSLTMSTSALEEFFEPGVDFWTCESSPEAIADAIAQIYERTACQIDWKKTREKTHQIFSVSNYHQVIERVLNDAVSDFTSEI